jgi:GH18 family chitinase
MARPIAPPTDMSPARGRRLASWLVVASLLAGCGGTPPAGSVPPIGASQSAGTLPSGEGSSCESSATAATTPAPSGSSELLPSAKPAAFRIVGYVGDTDGTVDQIQFDKLTQINYAFLTPNGDGTITDLTNPSKLDEIVACAHAVGVKVLISVGGWGWDSQFENFVPDPVVRATFVRRLNEFVAAHALDGVDIDWEYPDPGVSAGNYLSLMRELRAALPKSAELTAAVVAEGQTGGGILPDVFPLVDFLNLMAYDGPGPSHSPYSYAEASLAYWSARGLPRDKTVLGVPFYSRPTEVPYRKLVAASANAPNADELDYLGTTVNYNGMATIKAKTELALSRASGIMAWSLAQDTTDSTSLLSVIDAAVRAAGRR